LKKLIFYFLVALISLQLINSILIIRDILELQKVKVEPYTPPNRVLGITIKLADAIKTKESGGNYHAKGASGEYGAYQFMPSTYNALSKKCLGSIVPPTPVNQDKIVHCTIQELLEDNRTPKEIIQWWNSGSFTRCSKGVNKFNIHYDCPAYVQSVLALVK
jgi:hypothetical protein